MLDDTTVIIYTIEVEFFVSEILKSFLFSYLYVYFVYGYSDLN